MKETSSAITVLKEKNERLEKQIVEIVEQNRSVISTLKSELAAMKQRVVELE